MKKKYFNSSSSERKSSNFNNDNEKQESWFSFDDETITVNDIREKLNKYEKGMISDGEHDQYLLDTLHLIWCISKLNDSNFSVINDLILDLFNVCSNVKIYRGEKNILKSMISENNFLSSFYDFKSLSPFFPFLSFISEICLISNEQNSDRRLLKEKDITFKFIPFISTCILFEVKIKKKDLEDLFFNYFWIHDNSNFDYLKLWVNWINHQVDVIHELVNQEKDGHYNYDNYEIFENVNLEVKKRLINFDIESPFLNYSNLVKSDFERIICDIESAETAEIKEEDFLLWEENQNY